MGGGNVHEAIRLCTSLTTAAISPFPLSRSLFGVLLNRMIMMMLVILNVREAAKRFKI